MSSSAAQSRPRSLVLHGSCQTRRLQRVFGRHGLPSTKRLHCLHATLPRVLVPRKLFLCEELGLRNCSSHNQMRELTPHAEEERANKKRKRERGRGRGAEARRGREEGGQTAGRRAGTGVAYPRPHQCLLFHKRRHLPHSSLLAPRERFVVTTIHETSNCLQRMAKQRQ